jgi:hypothetical protein
MRQDGWIMDGDLGDHDECRRRTAGIPPTRCSVHNALATHTLAASRIGC